MQNFNDNYTVAEDHWLEWKFYLGIWYTIILSIEELFISVSYTQSLPPAQDLETTNQSPHIEEDLEKDRLAN